MKPNLNFAWVVIYLRNSDERIRAVRLAADVLGIGLREAAEWVDSVKFIYKPVSMAKARAFHAEYPTFSLGERLRDYTVPEVSHWPLSCNEEPPPLILRPAFLPKSGGKPPHSKTLRASPTRNSKLETRNS